MDEGLAPFDPASDFFKELTDYKPEEVKDDNEFKVLKGSYLTRVSKLVHNIGVSTKDGSPYDFYSLNLQVVETIDGDKGENRYFNKRYNNNPEKLKALMNDLFTAGIEFDKTSREAFDLSLSGAVDKQIKVRAWGWTPEKKMDGTPIPEEDRTTIQQLKIIKDFGKKSKTTTSDNVPF
jgi:hypothetical protein